MGAIGRNDVKVYLDTLPDSFEWEWLLRMVEYRVHRNPPAADPTAAPVLAARPGSLRSRDTIAPH